MSSIKRRIFISLVLLVLLFIFTGAEVNNTIDLPEIGKWMITKKGEPADWLGQAYKGKRLLEPINVIIVDGYSSNGGDGFC